MSMAAQDLETQNHAPVEQLVIWLANHFALPVSKAALSNSLPDDFEKRGKLALPRALEAVGLKSAFALRDLREIDPIVLPCVVFKKDGSPLILVALSDKRKVVTIIDLSQGNHQQEMAFRKLRRSLSKDVLLVTAASDHTARRLDPESDVSGELSGHWLWRPIRQNWSAWLQILIAALGINLFAVAVPLFVMNVYDRVIPNLAFVTLWTLAGGVALVLGLDLILKIIRTNVLELTSRRVDVQIASALFRQAMNITLLNRPGGAAGMASQIRDFETVRDFFTSSSFIAIIDLLFIGIFVAVLWMIVGPIAIVPLLAVPVVIALGLIAQIPIGASVARSQQLATKRHTVLVESLMGVETVKSVNGEPVMQREWENAVAASARINGKTRFWSNFAINATMLVQQSVSVIIIIWGVYLVFEGTITVGGLIAANILAGRVLAPLGNICQTLIRAQQAFKSLSSISMLMQLPTEAAIGKKSSMVVRDGAVELRDISFTYPDAPVAALSNFNLKVEKGEMVALLGRVGSGKSTLGKILVALLEPQEGLVLIDNHEIKQFSRPAVREGIGYLPQDPELFTGTIRENLLLGRSNASDEELNRALYFAGMDYFVAENPEGLNQFVGEKGNRLSGGQRQAIGLARLLLRRPKLIFLDEPTNAMDTTTEGIVIGRLKELSAEGVGLILCTHRQSLASIAPRFVVIDKGKKLLDGPKQQVLDALAGKIVKRGKSE